LLFVGSSRRSDHPPAHVRFALLEAGEVSRRIKDLPLVMGEKKAGGDNGFILQEISELIQKGLKKNAQ